MIQCIFHNSLSHYPVEKLQNEKLIIIDKRVKCIRNNYHIFSLDFFCWYFRNDSFSNVVQMFRLLIFRLQISKSLEIVNDKPQDRDEHQNDEWNCHKQHWSGRQIPLILPDHWPWGNVCNHILVCVDQMNEMLTIRLNYNDGSDISYNRKLTNYIFPLFLEVNC